MMLLSLSACYLVNKNDATVFVLSASAYYLVNKMMLLSLSACYLVNKNDASPTFTLLLSQ